MHLHRNPLPALTEPLAGVRAVLFDLDGTLFDRDASLGPLLDDQYNRFSSKLRRVARDVFIDRVIALDAHGYVSKQVVYLQIAAEFGLERSLAAALVDDFHECYSNFARPFDGVNSTLQRLMQEGLKLGIITNGSERMQSSVIHALQIGGCFNAITISETVGIRKPDARIFHQTARDIGVPVSECCFVGDHPDVDVGGAISAGMKAIWKRTSYWIPPSVDVPTIDNVSQLRAGMLD